MTNNLPETVPLCCPAGGSGDIWPLVVVVLALLAGRFLLNLYRQRPERLGPKTVRNMAIVAAVVVAAGFILAIKHDRIRPLPAAPAKTARSDTGTPGQAAALPRLVDLGANKCVQCKMMTQILEDLKTTYAGQLQIEFIDVWDNPDAGNLYGIATIPTQIFYDANGRELFRHEGYFPREDILAKWQELGVALTAPAQAMQP